MKEFQIIKKKKKVKIQNQKIKKHPKNKIKKKKKVLVQMNLIRIIKKNIKKRLKK